MPEPFLISAGNAEHGIADEETGLSTESVSATFNDPISYLMDRYNGRRGRASGFDPSRSMTITGEVIDTAADPSILKIVFASKYVTQQTWPDNFYQARAAQAGGAVTWSDNWALDDGVTMDKSRDGWFSVSVPLVEIPAITMPAPPA